MYKKINSLLFDVYQKKDLKNALFFYTLHLGVLLVSSLAVVTTIGISYTLSTVQLAYFKLFMLYLLPPLTFLNIFLLLVYPLILDFYILFKKNVIKDLIYIIIAFIPIILYSIGFKGPLFTLIAPAFLTSLNPNKKLLHKQ